ncbi:MULTISPECIES: rRNA adenine N-6-methyltransferase family protein [unclassified Streptomyces]|uniref:rRNA adenine N-6-methyltransferase family protein n=1 Tax=unclassified Streptomyces TaxID=2593676 RepID=UPI00202543FE|nr:MULTISPECIES: rRNA adenine N-6-methyltransferase family protein [unclassified Streptomyces]MCX4550573.1 methyltransferase [Streptomyces sp. NBC_01500]WSC22020.1 methyltransferase [Streptomyces sp. NBC_01766]
MRFPTDALTVLTDPRTVIRGDQVRIPFEIDRVVYEQVNTVLKDMAGKWDGRKAIRAHVFPYRIEEFMRQCLTAGEYPSRYDQGWYATPPALVTQIVDAAGIRVGDTVLEPSAGAGALTADIASRGGLVDAVELDERRAAILRAQGDCQKVMQTDFLSLDPLDREEGYDRIVMNPPFNNGLDHILHAVGFMKDDGHLIAVMSNGLMWWSDRKAAEFREVVEEVGGDIEALPEDSFAISGTNVRTCLVFLPGYAGSRLRTHDWLKRQPRQLDLFEFAE